ncbi:hypothetical protein [Peribacillus frigoritolerans]|uniref:hypothetical protein n=1 Tax=Peribacillus frigoritolerans TaxID=450367 RepID=UPI0010712CDA|nr:hypothetical protein [Peribacillus frigoritolerans]TFH63495.1 hypothetical protein E4J71_07030 [Peribacillus frigoritolerans]
MKDQVGMTVGQINRNNLEELAEKVAQRQQASLERHQKIANGFGRSMNQNYNISEMTATANGLLDGSINPKEFGMENAVEFTNQCITAVRDLNKKLQHIKTSAGMAYMQNRLDSYKKLKQETEDTESKIALFENFI